MTGAKKIMRRATVVALMALCCLTLALPAVAVKRPTFVNGDVLGRLCGAGNDKDRGVCLGYIMGVADISETLAVAGELAGGGKRIFCLPDEATAGQAANVVTLWLGDHPEARDWAGDAVVWTAFKEKFACN